LLASGPAWAGAAVLAAALVPDLAWNLGRAQAEPAGTGDVGILYQLARLQPGTWSWGPLALYLRPLYFLRVEGTISEYASLTTIPGAIVLASALASLLVLRGTPARLLQVLGFGTFAFFCLASSPFGEFWWADLSLPVFLALTAGVLASLPRARALAMAGAVLLLAAPGFRVATSAENYFPLEWGAPPEDVITRYRTSQAHMISRFRERDHAALCRAGVWRLPAAEYYRRSVEAYAEYLSALQAGERASAWRRRGWPPVEKARIDEELAWAVREARRLGAGDYST
jgi:hypothetical protein